MTSRLHLPSLSIERFRGIRDLGFPSLGRVTLLAGKNGVGKTSVLDAIRCYASKGDTGVLIDVVAKREEFVTVHDQDGDVVQYPDLASLFIDDGDYSGTTSSPRFRIGSSPKRLDLTVRMIDAEEDSEAVDLFRPEPLSKDFLVEVGKHKRNLPGTVVAHHHGRRGLGRPFPLRRHRRSWAPSIQFESLGPGLLPNDDMARLWDKVALTETENIAIEALRLVVGESLERIAVVADDFNPLSSGRRRFVAKFASLSTPVPLKRLGDGANRLLTIALALANCNDGILLIDEVENGIHYSIQPALWRMIFGAAAAGNVQVVAATHSWDCIVGFAAAATQTPVEGVLYRLESFENELHAIRYSEENLAVAARQRTEVR